MQILQNSVKIFIYSLAIASLFIILLQPQAALGRQDNDQLKVSVVPEETDKQALELLLRARKLHQSGKAKQALEIIDRAFALVQAVAPGANMATAFLLDEAGHANQALGKTREAAALAVASINMKVALFPPKDYPLGHVTLVQGFNNAGEALRRTGEVEEGEKYVRASYQMAKHIFTAEAFPNGHPLLQVVSNSLGVMLYETGRYQEAAEQQKAALTMAEALYPEDRFPKGHESLLQTLSNLADTFTKLFEYQKAEQLFQRADEMAEALFPLEKFPRSHPLRAVIFNNRGFLASSRGDYPAARRHYSEAITSYRKLYSTTKFPNGHPMLALSLHNLAVPLENLGEITAARETVDASIKMYESLGMGIHSTPPRNEMAFCLETRSRLWRAVGDLDKSTQDISDSVSIRRKVFPSERFPNGHQDLARAVGKLGTLLDAQEDREAAVVYLKEALGMSRKLFPQDAYPQGHPLVAENINNLAVVLEKTERTPEVLEFFEENLNVNRNLYPVEQYPFGHDDLCKSLVNYGLALLKRGNIKDGIAQVLEGYNAFEQQSRFVTTEVSEGEAMNFTRSLPRVVDTLLTYWPDSGQTDQSLYKHLCLHRGMKTRVLADRFSKLRNSSDPQVRKLYEEYRTVRRDMAWLQRARARKGSARTRSELSRRKEALERDLAKAVTAQSADFSAQSGLASIKSLQQNLPDKSAVVEFFLYHDRRTGDPSYSAFILTKSKPVHRVDLGSAKTIDSLVKEWREWIALTPERHMGQEIKDAEIEAEDLSERQKGLLSHVWETTANEDLGQRIWPALQSRLPENCETIYLIPDGSLSFVPWCALPVGESGELLIEKHLLLQTPDTPWLAGHLATVSRPPANMKKGHSLMAVGGVFYDELPDDDALQFTNSIVEWDREMAKASKWLKPTKANYLAGSAMETAFAAACAGDAPKILFSGKQANVEAVSQSLCDANCALLSTHGSYQSLAKSQRKDSVLLDSSLMLADRERTSLLERNPFLRISLLLSGSEVGTNTPTETIPITRRLTGLQIASLPLDNLQLVFLSACQSALGDVRSGEEIYGFPTAFHLAGARNVVGTQWSVPDAETARLTMAFSYKVLKENKSPAIALRETQLLYLRSPEALADWDGMSPPPELNKTNPAVAASVKTLRQREAYFWAAFYLSGIADQ